MIPHLTMLDDEPVITEVEASPIEVECIPQLDRPKTATDIKRPVRQRPQTSLGFTEDVDTPESVFIVSLN